MSRHFKWWWWHKFQNLCPYLLKVFTFTSVLVPTLLTYTGKKIEVLFKVCSLIESTPNIHTWQIKNKGPQIRPPYLMLESCGRGNFWNKQPPNKHCERILKSTECCQIGPLKYINTVFSHWTGKEALELLSFSMVSVLSNIFMKMKTIKKKCG